MGYLFASWFLSECSWACHDTYCRHSEGWLGGVGRWGMRRLLEVGEVAYADLSVLLFVGIIPLLLLAWWSKLLTKKASWGIGLWAVLVSVLYMLPSGLYGAGVEVTIWIANHTPLGYDSVSGLLFVVAPCVLTFAAALKTAEHWQSARPYLHGRG